MTDKLKTTEPKPLTRETPVAFAVFNRVRKVLGYEIPLVRLSKRGQLGPLVLMMASGKSDAEIQAYLKGGAA